MGHETDMTASLEPSGLPVEVQGQIGRKLRQVYGKMLAEPMPQKISELLEDLDKATKATVEPKT